jgi:hypothetical protein
VGIRLDERSGSIIAGRHGIESLPVSFGCPPSAVIEEGMINGLSDLDAQDTKVSIVWSPRCDPRIHASEDIRIKYNTW